MRKISTMAYRNIGTKRHRAGAYHCLDSCHSESMASQRLSIRLNIEDVKSNEKASFVNAWYILTKVGQ